MEEKAIRPKRVAVHYIPPPARKHQDAKIQEVHKTKGRPLAVNEYKVEKLCNDSSLLFRDSHSERKVKLEKTNRSSKTRMKPCSRGKGNNLNKSPNLTFSNECVPPLIEARVNLSEIANLPPLETGFDPCEENGLDSFSTNSRAKQLNILSKTIIESKQLSQVDTPNEIINRINETKKNTVLESQSQKYNELELQTESNDCLTLNNDEIDETGHLKGSVVYKEPTDHSSIVDFNESIDINEPIDGETSNENVDFSKESELVKVMKINDPLEVSSLAEVAELVNTSVDRGSLFKVEESNILTKTDKLVSPIEDDTLIKNERSMERTSEAVPHYSMEVSSSEKNVLNEVLFSTELSNGCSPNIALQSDFSVDDSDWDILYNDHGECVISPIVSKPKKADANESLKSSTLTDDDLCKDQRDDNSSIIEIYGFSEDLRTSDLHTVFCNYVSRGFILKWVDNTHALGILPSPSLAQEVLVSNLPLVKTRPISQGTSLSQEKAKTLILPSAMRPKTCSALARRLVSGALGLRVNISPEERAAEKKLLKEAREKKKMILMQKEAAWEGNVSLLGEPSS